MAHGVVPLIQYNTIQSSSSYRSRFKKLLLLCLQYTYCGAFGLCLYRKDLL